MSASDAELRTSSAFLTLSQFDRDSFSTVHLRLVRPQPSLAANGRHTFETVLPIGASGIHIDSPDALICRRIVTRVHKNKLASESDSNFLDSVVGATVTVGDISGRLTGYDESTLLIASEDHRVITSVKRPDRLVASLSEPSESRAEGTYIQCELTFLLPEPPQTWTVDIRYQVSSRVLGWQPQYQASVLDNSAQLTALFKIRNELSESFENARVIFSTHSLGESDPNHSTPISYSTSSDYVSSLSSAKKTKASIFSKRPVRAPARLQTYRPETEYFYLNGAPITIAAKQTQSLVYHHHRFDFEASECWFVFDASADFPKPGLIRTDDLLTKNTISSSSLPYMIDVANTEENGFGCDLPTGSAEIYTNSHLLPSLYMQPPMSQFFDTDTFAASFRGERVRIPVHNPSDFFTCTKERTSYRHAGTTLTETFTYTVENARGAAPVDVLIVDCAFRHHEWYILRQSTACDRIGTHFFQIPVRQVPYGARVEVSITIEYAFNLAAPTTEATHNDSSDDQSHPHASTSTTTHHHQQRKVKTSASSTGGFLGSLFSK